MCKMTWIDNNSLASQIIDLLITAHNWEQYIWNESTNILNVKASVHEEEKEMEEVEIQGEVVWEWIEYDLGPDHGLKEG